MDRYIFLAVILAISFWSWRHHLMLLRRCKDAETGKKQLAEDYLLLQIQAEKTAKESADKDQLFFMIAHDLRGPVAGPMALVQILEDTFFEMPPAEQASAFALLRNNLDSAGSLLENLLLWSRFRCGTVSFNPEPINLHSVVSGQLQDHQALLNAKNITVKNSIDERICIYGDYKMIDFVFKKLLTNACRFTSEQGTVHISGNIFMNDISGQEDVLISVEDSGTGMTTDTLEKLFKVEQRGTSSQKHPLPGTGLGLVICRECVEKHKGTITAESTPGKGSRFIMVLPALT